MIIESTLQDDIRNGLNVELVNLAERLDKDQLQKIGYDLIERINDDLASRIQWEEKHSEWKKIYDQSDQPVNRPWLGSSTESIPIMTEACNLFQARGYKALFPSRNFINAMPVGVPNEKTRERAERVARHMSFQLAIMDKNYKRDKNAMLLAIALNGSDFSKTFFDPVQKKNVVERVRAVDLVVPYTVGKTRIEEVERKTHIIYMTENEGKYREKIKFFTEAPVRYQQSQYTEIQREEDRLQGTYKQSDRYFEYCKVYECHCLLDLDDNGIAEPYIVWIDAQERKILRVQIRYEIDQKGKPTDYKKPIEYFTHFYFLENPDGFYGLGYGHLIANLNKAGNKMLRMGIDAAELANTASGFINENLDVKGGEVEMQIGKFIKVSSPISDIQNGIYQMSFPGAHPSLVNLMQLVEGYSRRISSSTDAASGDVDKVIQPMTMATMLEQTLQMPTSVLEQLSMSLEDEFDKLYELNGKYLTSSAYYIDGDELIPISPEDYQEDLRIFPIFDPRNMTRQQKIAKNQEIYQFVTTNPVLNQNPENLTNITKTVLDGMEVENVEQYMNPPPPPPEPPQPQQIDDPKQENFQFLMPPDQKALFDVFPDQDHAAHLQDHMSLLQGPSAQDVTPESMQAIQLHMQKHKAFIYQQEQQRQQDEQRRLGLMAQQQNNQGGFSPFGGDAQGGPGMAQMQDNGGSQLPEGAVLGAGLTPQDIGDRRNSIIGQELPPQYFMPPQSSPPPGPPQGNR